jgi:hypothetical protein
VQGDPLPSPFAGATDLNDDRATETLGILFMEGQGEPAEITRLKADLSVLAEAYRSTGQWLTSAMEAGWSVAEALLGYPELADLLADVTHQQRLAERVNGDARRSQHRPQSRHPRTSRIRTGRPARRSRRRACRSPIPLLSFGDA